MNTVTNIEKTVCRRCLAVLNSSDKFCRHCGAATEHVGDGSSWLVSVEVVPERRRSNRAILENPWTILAMLFLVMGPLALPLLWWSRRFSIFWKIVLSILVTVYITGLGYLAWCAVQQTWESIKQLQM